MQIAQKNMVLEYVQKEKKEYNNNKLRSYPRDFRGKMFNKISYSQSYPLYPQFLL